MWFDKDLICQFPLACGSELCAKAGMAPPYTLRSGSLEMRRMYGMVRFFVYAVIVPGSLEFIHAKGFLVVVLGKVIWANSVHVRVCIG